MTLLHSVVVVGLPLIALVRFVSWSPLLPGTGEGAYGYALAWAAAHGLQHGTDIVYTYGPLSPYFSFSFVYYGATQFTVGLAVTSFVILTYAVAFMHLGRHAGWPALGLLCAGVFYAPALMRNVAVFTAPLLLAFAVVARPTPMGWPLEAALVAVTALGAGSKGTTCASSFVILGILDLYLLLGRRPRAVPRYLASCLVLLAAMFWLAGQAPTSLPRVLAGYAAISSAFTEAMLLPGPFSEVAAFLALQACIQGATLWMLQDRPAVARGCYMVASLTYAFVLWKAAFVRHDSHAFAGYACVVLQACLLVCAAGGNRRRERTLASAMLAIVLVVTMAGATFLRGGQYMTDPRGAFVTRTLLRASDLVALLRPGRLHELAVALEQREADIRQAEPLPVLQGTVDEMSAQQAVLLAHHVDYRPRPVFQGYQANSAKLLSLNRKFLESDRAPDHVLLRFGPWFGMDRVYWNEGGSWLTLLRYYDFERYDDPWLVLERAAHARGRPVRVSRHTVPLGSTVAVPAAQGDLIVASIRLKRTWLGELGTLLYKIPLPTIALERTDGLTRRTRLVTNITKADFPVSREIQSVGDLTALFLGDGTQDVKAIHLAAPDGLAHLFYRAEAKIIFKRFRLQRQDELSDRARVLVAMCRRADVDEGRRPLLLVEPDQRGWGLHAMAIAPSRTWLPAPASGWLRVRYGARPNQGTAPATLRISHQGGDGTMTLLWSDEVWSASRAETRFAVVQSPPIGRLAFEVVAPKANPTVAYWADVEFLVGHPLEGVAGRPSPP